MHGRVVPCKSGQTAQNKPHPYARAGKTRRPRSGLAYDFVWGIFFSPPILRHSEMVTRPDPRVCRAPLTANERLRRGSPRRPGPRRPGLVLIDMRISCSLRCRSCPRWADIHLASLACGQSWVRLLLQPKWCGSTSRAPVPPPSCGTWGWSWSCQDAWRGTTTPAANRTGQSWVDLHPLPD